MLWQPRANASRYASRGTLCAFAPEKHSHMRARTLCESCGRCFLIHFLSFAEIVFHCPTMTSHLTLSTCRSLRDGVTANGVSKFSRSYVRRSVASGSSSTFSSCAFA